MASNIEIHRMFVYGTLRRGCMNHIYLQKAKYVGYGKTASKFSMYVDYIPYVIRNRSYSHIIGEVYIVDGDSFIQIDRLEGHPHFYERQITDIILKDGHHLKCWMYFYKNRISGEIISSGDYKKYNN
jgi:gamma-glutamylaminecyclotransferase